MLEDQGDPKPTANAADNPPEYNSIQANTDIIRTSDATDSSDVTSILTSTFNFVGGHPEAKDYISAAVMALNQAWNLYHSLILVLLVYYASGFPPWLSSFPPPHLSL